MRGLKLGLRFSLEAAQYPVKVSAAKFREFSHGFFPDHLLPMQKSRTLSVDAAPYEFEFEPARCALLVIDMQRDFLEPLANKIRGRSKPRLETKVKRKKKNE